MLRRAGIFDAMQNAFLRNFYDDQNDALEYAQKKRDRLEDTKAKIFENTSANTQNSFFDRKEKEVGQ